MANPYDHSQADKLGKYVRKRYRNQLSNGDLSFYLCAFPYLEQEGLGLCQPITATYKQLAETGLRDKSGLRKTLNALNGVLCEVVFGSPIKGEREATRLRRFSLVELMNGEPSRRLIDYSPADAKELASLLSQRCFVYGDNYACKPFWNVLKTGRVQSSRPNVQSDPERARIENLCTGLEPGQVLIYADYKSAEPTILQHAINYRFESDPYQTAAALLGMDRDSAKPKINSLAYMPKSQESLKFWQNRQAEEFFRDYAAALDQYKEKLWQTGKPRSKQRRFVNTLTGRKIQADRAKPPHRGQVLSWHIQGTVADLLNAATLKLIQREDKEGWKVAFPVHDAVYVIGTPEQAQEIKQVLETESQLLKLPLAVKVETFNRGDVV